jgi:hypothetical protein
MAVRADDLAFVDLGLDAGPGISQPYELWNAHPLIGEMVELECAQVGGSTIDARVFREVIEHSLVVGEPL